MRAARARAVRGERRRARVHVRVGERGADARVRRLGDGVAAGEGGAGQLSGFASRASYLGVYIV